MVVIPFAFRGAYIVPQKVLGFTDNYANTRGSFVGMGQTATDLVQGFKNFVNTAYITVTGKSNDATEAKKAEQPSDTNATSDKSTVLGGGKTSVNAAQNKTNLPTTAGNVLRYVGSSAFGGITQKIDEQKYPFAASQQKTRQDKIDSSGNA